MGSRRGRSGRDASLDLAHPLGRVMWQLPAGLQPPGAPRLGPRSYRRGSRVLVIGRSLAISDDLELGPVVLCQPRSDRSYGSRRTFVRTILELRDQTVASQHAPHGLRSRPHTDRPDRDARLDRMADLREVFTSTFVVVMLTVVALAAFPQ